MRCICDGHNLALEGLIEGVDGQHVFTLAEGTAGSYYALICALSECTRDLGAR